MAFPVKRWSGDKLFPTSKSGKNSGLVQLSNGKYINEGSTEKEGWTRMEFINVDPNWKMAFNLIDLGLLPEWDADKENWLDFGLSLSQINLPENNDGREHCAACLSKTTSIQGFNSIYNICKNQYCSMNGK